MSRIDEEGIAEFVAALKKSLGLSSVDFRSDFSFDLSDWRGKEAVDRKIGLHIEGDCLLDRVYEQVRPSTWPPTQEDLAHLKDKAVDRVETEKRRKEIHDRIDKEMEGN